MNGSLPDRVKLTEVCPRDGFQNIKTWIPTETKLQVIDKLIDAGLRSVEITSFVSPKAIPQMADATEVAAHVLKRVERDGLDLDAVALAPNLRGAAAAHNVGLKHVNYVISASVAHNKANINRTHEESLADLDTIVRTYPGMHVTLSIATTFGCPFLGETPIEQVLWLIGEVQKRGARDITLCDTIGVANPAQTAAVIEAVQTAYPALDLALHMHDTHGMALANMLVGLQNGVTRLETAAGGLGGCPFAPGAAGNAATEDTINMLHRMGIATGINLGGTLTAVALIHDQIQQSLTSHLAGARSYAEHTFWRKEGDEDE